MNHHLQALMARIRSVSPASETLETSDARLLERWLEQRDEAAFELIVWRHGGMVLDLCRRVLNSAADVEDAFQATFLVLVRKAGSVRQRSSLGSWLYKVAWRIALAARARSARLRAGELVPESVAAPAEEDALAFRDLREAVAREIERLPERYRLPLVLCCLQGLTVDQAAATIGCSRWTLATRLARAKDRLRQSLGRREFTLSSAALGGLLAQAGGVVAAPPALVQQTTQACLAFTGHAASTALSPTAVLLAQTALCQGMAAPLTALAVMVGLSLGGLGWALSNGPEQIHDSPPPVTVEQSLAEQPPFLEPEPVPPVAAGERPLSFEALKVVGLGEGQRVILAWPAKDQPREAAFRWDASTDAQFSWVGRGEATPAIGFQAARGFVSTAAEDLLTRVHFNGQQRYQRAPETERPPDWQGTVLEVGPVGELTLEIKKEQQPAQQITIELTPMTRELYFRVPLHGAEPRVGYRATIWLAEGSPTAATHAYFNPR